MESIKNFWFILLSGFLALSGCESQSQVDKATAEGVLIMGNSKEPKSLDPHMVTGVLESNILRALFEGLVKFHPSDDEQSPLGVAKSITPNANFTEWKIELRDDARWSDGHPVTADDFAFSYERILTPKFGAKYADMLYFLKGAEAFNKGAIDSFSEVGFQQTGRLSFTLTLRGSTPYFKELLKHLTWYPVPKHVVLQYGAMDQISNQWSKPRNIIGNGPFQVKSHRRNDHLEVTKNQNYWDAAKVSLNGIRFLPVSNQFTEARMFRNEQMHVTYSCPAEIVDLMQQKDPQSLRLEPYLGNAFYRFNTRSKPLDDVSVRRALSMAIDREALCKSVYRGFTPADAMTPPMGAYQPPRGLIAFDPEKARQLLAKAGFPNGEGFPRLSFMIVSSESNQTHAAAAQAMWREHLNINIEIVNKDWAGYLDARSKGDYEILMAGWIGDYRDPLTFIEMWSAGNKNNMTGWENPEFTRALNESYQAPTVEARLSLLQQAESVLIKDSPVVPVAWRGKAYLLHPDVQGWEPLLLDSHPYTDVSLKKKGDR